MQLNLKIKSLTKEIEDLHALQGLEDQQNVIFHNNVSENSKTDNMQKKLDDQLKLTEGIKKELN